jgi:hypothetical protein
MISLCVLSLNLPNPVKERVRARPHESSKGGPATPISQCSYTDINVRLDAQVVSKKDVFRYLRSML